MNLCNVQQDDIEEKSYRRYYRNTDNLNKGYGGDNDEDLEKTNDDQSAENNDENEDDLQNDSKENEDNEQYGNNDSQENYDDNDRHQLNTDDKKENDADEVHRKKCAAFVTNTIITILFDMIGTNISNMLFEILLILYVLEKLKRLSIVCDILVLLEIFFCAIFNLAFILNVVDWITIEL